ncbi:MAG: cupin domain-containing protein [Proteobacteria bacterium]|nr:cupin domain-containing protein [Pseudomonadota bacterium]
MPKLDLDAIAEISRTGYLEPYRKAVEGRRWKPLADGLGDFGVNLVTLAPGAASSQRHWHTEEDELVYMLEGEVVLIEDDGETILRAGDVAAWPKGVANGHQLVNRSDAECRFLAIGSDKPDVDACHYPDIDQFYSARTGFTPKPR